MYLMIKPWSILLFILAIVTGCAQHSADTQGGDLFPGAVSSGYSGDCGGRNIVGRYTLDYDYASVSTPGKVFTGSKSEWHLHTQKGCFLWGLGMWSKPEAGIKGCVNWVLYWEDNGAGPLVGMMKDVAGDRFLGYGRIDPETSMGVVWDRFEDQKMEAVFMNKSDSETLHKSCADALAQP